MSNLSTLGGIGFVIMAVIAWFFKNKADKSASEAIVAKVEAADAPLAARQADDASKIKEVDKGIEEMKAERERLRNEYLTDQQRADKWNKPKY